MARSYKRLNLGMIQRHMIHDSSRKSWVESCHGHARIRTRASIFHDVSKARIFEFVGIERSCMIFDMIWYWKFKINDINHGHTKIKNKDLGTIGMQKKLNPQRYMCQHKLGLLVWYFCCHGQKRDFLWTWLIVCVNNATHVLGKSKFRVTKLGFEGLIDRFFRVTDFESRNSLFIDSRLLMRHDTEIFKEDDQKTIEPFA